jgi:hypothetical protein
MKTINYDKAFDFDHWRELAKTDPEAFERKRREAVDAVINSAAPDFQQRLRGLQWRVDMERRRSANPTNSCLSIYNMMWKRVYGDGGLMDSLNSLLGPESTTSEALSSRKAAKSADVLNFKAGNS